MSAATSTATGAQYEIRYGVAHAVITEIGAGLRLFEVAGVPYTETYGADEHPPLGCGAVLVPWPNRVAGARWEWQGVEQQLAATEAERGNAIHGLARNQAWRRTLDEPARIELETDIPVQDGWPVPLRTSICYALDETGLTVTHTVVNVGDAPIPFGVGTHPYPRPGRSARAESTLELSADTYLPLDADTMIPSAPPQPLAGTAYTSPINLATTTLDTPFGGATPSADGLIHHRLTGPDGGVELWADPDFRWVQAFTAEFGGREVVAVEPMTCPPDALNSGTDLITLAPAQTWSARWGLRPLD
jgi:aldose 1-epimerase